MKRLFALLCALALALLVSSCATTGDGEGAEPTVQTDPGVSVLPWSMPQSWENRGMLGAYADYFDRR